MKNSKSLALVIACVAGFCAINSFAAQKQYTLTGSAPTGTLLKSTDLTSSIPLDKSYRELDAIEKNNVRKRFSGLSENQTPPFPVHGMEAIYKPIIAEHKKLARGGKLALIATINEAGQVETLRVADSPSKAMAKVSSRVLRNTQFDPGYCSGEPCKMDFPLEIKFQ